MRWNEETSVDNVNEFTEQDVSTSLGDLCTTDVGIRDNEVRPLENADLHLDPKAY